jgi:CubicO group peptidase (beta-lactamase class C family)/D-alanyl-D-alanine dipeptidase
MRSVHPIHLLVVCLAGFFVSQVRANPPEKYREAIKALEPWIAEEVKLKKIPSLSLALVDDQTVVWAHSFGEANPAKHELATPETLYRVGSVSKPFTALLLMMFVEMGLIDLDAPIQDYLPEFQPINKSGKKITLRQMLSHRSGIVREGPIGNYFDDTEPSLADSVKSISKLELVFEPGAMTSYSNMAVATAGYVLERTQKESFAKLMQKKLLDPIGMKNSSFSRTHLGKNEAKIARASMWSLHGREFPAPVWDFGMGPAGNLYSPVNDMAQFLKFLFAGGRSPAAPDAPPLLKRETLEKMWTIQFPKEGEKSGFGIGFFVSDLNGKRVIRHGGAVYGFSTEFAALPDDKLGVIVCSSKDVTNAATSRIANTALQHMLAVKAEKELPKLENSKPLEPEVARALVGRYRNGDKTIECYERAGKVWIFPHRAGTKYEVRRLGGELITDDMHGFGLKISREGRKLVLNKVEYEPVEDRKPEPSPAKWAGLLGEYGWDHNILIILEKGGVLYAQIEWQFLYPLKEESENVFKFPDYGLYMGDKIVFERGKDGQAVHADAGSVLFKRRPLPRRGETFKIKPVQPVDELRKIALKAQPPDEKNVLLRKPELVDVLKVPLDDKAAKIKLDIRYATANNFLGTPFYTSAMAYLQRPAAKALAEAHMELGASGYGLLIHDAYRPWHVTKMFRDATPGKFHHFVADPMQGSRHNRGCAVDLTLYDLKTGLAVDMTGGYDEFSDRSYPDYLGGTSLERWQRDLLRRTMEKHGFAVYEAEWWHFDFHDWRQYPILNTRFEDL